MTKKTFSKSWDYENLYARKKLLTSHFHHDEKLFRKFLGSLDNQWCQHVKYNQVGEIPPQWGVSKIIFPWDESHLTINVVNMTMKIYTREKSC